MPVPKYKTSKSKQRMRRSHDAITLGNGSLCANCGTVKRAHVVCDACGHYRGRQVMEPKHAELSMDQSFDTSLED